GCAAGFLDETVRVMRGRHRSNANGEAGRQQIIERTDRGIATSRVRVEAEHYFVHVAFENARVFSRQRGALRRDDVVDTGHVAGDQIELAFTHDGIASVEQRAF